MPVPTASSSSHSFLPPPDRKAIYPASFAADVWSRAYEKYARVWEFFLGVSKLTSAHMRYLIACNDPDWAVIRDFIHQLDKWRSKQRALFPDQDYLDCVDVTPSQMLSSLLRVKKNIGSDRLRSYLTAIISELQ
jgi:hypothetical protein